MKDFFISHNKADKGWAEWIAWQLEEAGYTIVLQGWDFPAGSNFVLEMQKATSGAERTIAVLSQDYLDALFTHPEWAAAFAKDPKGEQRTLIPVRIGECELKGLLSQIVYIDLKGLQEAAAKEQLLSKLKGRGKPEAKPDFPGEVARSVAAQPGFPGDPSAIFPESRGQWELVFSATVEDMHKARVEVILAHLKELSGDSNLTFVDIRPGSVIVVLEGSEEGFRRIKALLGEGLLKEIAGMPLLIALWVPITEIPVDQTTDPIYRVFLSSTAIDMEKHREKAFDVVVRLGHLPVAMETFGAIPKEPVDVCQNEVRKCDVLIVMVAHRYGWIPETDDGGNGHKSITWIEVETALEEGIPVFAFLVDMDHGWTQPKEQDLLFDANTRKEKDAVFEQVQALKNFRAFIDGDAGLTRDTFTTPDNLAMKVAISLSKWVLETKPAPETKLALETKPVLETKPAPETKPARDGIPTQRAWIFREVHPLQPAPHFRGRQDLLKDLQQWWEDPVHPDHVRSLVAIGGTGKTAVIEQFLENIREDKLHGSVLVWSFYEEPDTDAFLREANIVFAGEEGEGAGGTLQRLQRALSGSEPHLLVLDGLERIQSAGDGGQARGDLKDHRLKNLLRSIAAGLGRTRALVTSRSKLTDLEQWEGAGYRSRQLDVLDEQAAVSVLEAWQVEGDERELLALAESVGKHALSVSVLGSYLHHFCDGDPECAKDLNLGEIGRDESQAAKLGRVLAGYAKNLPDDERDLLIRISCFPGGASAKALQYLGDAGGEIAGTLAGINQAGLMTLAERLQKLGLVFTYDLRDSITYTAHPFLREYFRNLLGVPPEEIHEAVRSRLAMGLDEKPDTKPREPEVLDRYEALIEHSILAGRFKEAFELYHNAIGGGGGRNHLYHILGDYGRTIRITSHFAIGGEPQNIAPLLSVSDRTYLLSFWGLSAEALGDLSTAERCSGLHGDFSRDAEDWRELSISLQNSAGLSMYRGAFLSAKKLLIESLEHGKADDLNYRQDAHSFLAAVCHALGEISEAQKNFATATEILYEPLYSLNGIYEAEHLMALGHKDTAYERIAVLLALDHPPREISLYHALFGLLSLPDSISQARSHLEKVREWTDKSGHMDCIIRGHILAAEIAYCAGDYPGALSEATAGLNHAEGCGYGRFAIDLLLVLARIHLVIPDSRTALQNARQALDRSQDVECQYAWGEADALHLCGVCHKDLGEPELAIKRLEAALEVRTRIQHPAANETRELLDELNR